MGTAWERYGMCESALRVEVFKGFKFFVVFVWGMPLCGRAGRLPHHSSDIQVGNGCGQFRGVRSHTRGLKNK
jgi:hypothetical protein